MDIIKRHPVIAFFVVACLVGWLPYELAFLGIGSNPENLPLGPVVGALVVAGCAGRATLREWGRRLRSWRIHPGWYVLALLAPIAIHVVDVVVNHAFGAPLPTSTQLADWPQVPLQFVVFLVAVGLGEEGGWTAFAAPALLRRHSFWTSYLLLASMRILWHLPLMLSGSLPWVIGIVGNAGFQLIVLAMVRSGAGWTPAAVWHSALNAAGGFFFFPMVVGADRDRLGVLLAVAYGTVAVAVALAVRAGLRAPGPGAEVVVPTELSTSRWS